MSVRRALWSRLARCVLVPVEADQRARHQHEREPPHGIPLPAHLQPPEATQPGQRPPDLLPVAPKPGRRLHPTTSDPRPDPTPAQVGPVGSAVIALVGMDPGGSGTPPSSRGTDRRDVLHDRLERGGVGDVGGGHHRGQRQPATVAGQVELGPGLATIDGICAHLVPVEPVGSSINTRLPSASTASFAVFHDTPRPSATRATVKC